MFDQFRECILSNSNWESVLIQTSELPPDIVQWLRKTVQKCEHIAGIYIRATDIMAFSLLYGRSLGLFRLGTGHLGMSFSSAIVCDFEAGKETVIDKILL